MSVLIDSLIDSWRAALTLERCAEVFVASVTAPAHMVVGTQRVATVHRRLAEVAARGSCSAQ
jgi:hypothetical protein